MIDVSRIQRSPKKEHNFKLAQDLLALCTGQVVSRVFAFLAFVILARTLDPTAYGTVEYAVGLSVIFADLVEWGTGPIGVRELARSPQQALTLAARIPAARLALACLAIPIMGLSTTLTGQPRETVQLVWLFSIGLLAVPWKHDWLFQGSEMMTAAAAGQLIRTAAFAGGVVLCVRQSQHLLRIGMIEVAAAGIGVAYYLFVQNGLAPIRLHFSRTEFHNLLKEGFPVVSSSTVWNVIQFAPLFLVLNLSGGNQTAWFGTSQRIVVSSLAFSQLYHFNLYPTLVRKIASTPESLRRLVGASFRVVAWTAILIASIAALLAEPLLTSVFGKGFALAAPTFSILIWVVPVTLLSGHARWLLIASGKQQYVVLAHVAGLFAVFAAGAALIPTFGSAGAAVAMVLASLVVWAVAHLFTVYYVGRLPILFAAVPPAMIALACRLFTYGLGATPWMAAAISLCVLLLSALLFHRQKLFSDFTHLLQAKGDLDHRVNEATSI